MSICPEGQLLTSSTDGGHSSWNIQSGISNLGGGGSDWFQMEHTKDLFLPLPGEPKCTGI